MTTGQPFAYWLSDNGMTLVVQRRAPAGIATSTFKRAQPFTDADVGYILAEVPHHVTRMQPGQRNKTHRFVTRFGVLFLHIMTGPPTWRRPRLKREKDGTVMAGWLRLAVAVKFDWEGGPYDDA